MEQNGNELNFKVTSESDTSSTKKFLSVLKSLKSETLSLFSSFKKTESAISNVTNKMDSATKNVDAFKNSLGVLDKIKADPKLNIKELVKSKDEAISIIKEIEDAMAKLRESGPLKAPDFQQYLSYGKVVSDLKDKFKLPMKADLSDNSMKELQKDLDGVDNKLGNVGKETVKTSKKMGLLGTIGKGAIGLLKNNVGKLTGLLPKLANTTDSLFNKFKKLTLGLLTVRTAMSVLTRAVSAYLSFDGALSDSITNSWNMLGSLLAPAIEMVASLFATATNYIYNFVKALTGIDFVARANAKALKTQAAATKAAGQAQRSLSSMDEITNLQTDSAGGGGADIPQITAPEIDSKAMDFIKELIDKIKAGDWYGAGAYIAEQINKALERTDVKKFTDKVKKGILNATDMFNGFVETLNWSLLGEKTSDLAVGITGAIRAGIENVHWDSLGKGISDFLNAIDWVGLVDNIVSSITGIVGGIITVFNNIDFSKLMYNISQAVIKGIDDITKFLEKTDWTKVGQQIADMLLSIDWLGLAVSLVRMFAQGLQTLPIITMGFISKIPEKIKKIDWGKVGSDLINLLLEGIKLGLAFMFPMIVPFFDDIVNFIKSAFDGIKKIFAPIVDFFGNIFGTVFSNIKIVFDNILSIISGVVNYIGTMFKPVLDGLVEGFKVAWNGIKIAFSPMIDFFKNIINTIKNLLKNFGSSVGSVIGGAFKAVVNGVLRAIENILNAPIRAVNSLIKVINKVPGINLGKLNTFNLPRLATGTNNIEKEGIYHLHEGEAVVPKKYNPATGGYDNGADNKQIIDLLIDLNANMLALSEREMAVYMDSRKVAEGIYDDMQTVTKNKNMSSVMKRS